MIQQLHFGILYPKEVKSVSWKDICTPIVIFFTMERRIPTRVIAGQWVVWCVVSVSGVQPEFTGVGQIGGWKGKLGLQFVRKAGTSQGELELVFSSSLPVLVPQGVTCRGRWCLQTWSWYALCPGLREAQVREWRELGKLRSGADPSQPRGDLNQQGRMPPATESIKTVVLLLHFLLPNLVQNSPHGWHQQGTVWGEEFWEHSSMSAQQTWYKTIPGAFGHSGLISSGVHFLMVSASDSLVCLQSTLHDKPDLWVPWLLHINATALNCILLLLLLSHFSRVRLCVTL